MSKTDFSKERGLKHLKNKQKYKTNAKATVEAKKAIVNTRTTKRVHLESNWDRYEIDDEEDPVHRITRDTDFSVLASAPITLGTRFQFKNDLELADEVDVKTLDKLDIFRLNLNLLEASIGCISFDRRSGLNNEVFTESSKRIMNNTVLENKINYEKYLDTFDIKLNTVKFSSNFESDVENTSDVSQDEHDIDNSSSESAVNLDEDKMKEDLQKLKIQDNVTEVSKKSELKNNEDDLEKWLDDVLDD